MGSRSNIDFAYIAGFLDGDGSLMLQIKRRKDGRLRRRFMCTICFYQDRRHEEPLLWMRKILGIGYLSRRNDRISELRINGYKQVSLILKRLMPYLRFKKKQAKALYQASRLLSKNTVNKLSPKSLELLLGFIEIIQNNNYVAKRKKSREELREILGLTP